MTEFQLPAVSCGHCVRAVTEAIQSADPAATVQVDLAGKSVRIDSSQDRAVLAAALAEAGYPPA